MNPILVATLLFACRASEPVGVEPRPEAPPRPAPAPLEVKRAVPDLDPGAAAFAEAWRAVAEGREKDALTWLDAPAPDSAPAGYVAYLRGRLMLAAGRLEDAERELALVPPDTAIHRDAVAWRATAIERRGDSAAALPVYDELVAVPDPAPGSAHALASLASARPADADALWLRVWRSYPGAPEDAEATAAVGERAIWADAAARAAALGDAGAWQEARALLDAHAAEVVGAPAGADACRFHYVRGRASYKLGKRPDADAALAAAPEACAGVTEDDLGPKALYLHATLATARGHHNTAAARWRALSDAWPDHRYADDGLVKAGVALEHAGDSEGARTAWQDARTRHPDGDMTPEAEYRLMWSYYLAGRPADAREAAASLGQRAPREDRLYVAAGRYWGARLAIYPDVAAPSILQAAELPEALDAFEALVRDQPWSMYAVLAEMRLAELAPDRATAVAAPAAAMPATWTLRSALTGEPAFARAEGLVRVGLVPEAVAEWSELDASAMTAQEVSWWTLARTAAGDDIAAHRDLRVWLRDQIPDRPDGDAALLYRVAYPDAWWPEVSAAVAPYPAVPPRYLQGLVRTESNFDPSAISWAGARGLSQVMPATGARVGKWLGLTVGKADLLVPETNLAVGARYLDFLFEDTGNNPFLSAAGYNAGEGRVRQWCGEWGAVPTDEWVERVPFHETHGYVRRVVGTWATYAWLDGTALPYMKQLNHAACPADR